MKADGEVVGYHKYDSKTAEKTDVLKLIRRLLSEGISRNDIVILSHQYQMEWMHYKDSYLRYPFYTETR